MPDRRGPLEDGLRADGTSVPQQIAQQVARELTLHVEQMPLLEQRERDDQGEPLDHP